MGMTGIGLDTEVVLTQGDADGDIFPDFAEILVGSDHLDARGVVELDGRGDAAELGREVVRHREVALEEPVAQLALLRPRDARHLARSARAVLDEGERLQHGVVQVRGDLGALLLPHAGGPLAHEVAPQGDDARRDEHRDPEHDDADPEHGVERRRAGEQNRGTRDQQERGRQRAHPQPVAS